MFKRANKITSLLVAAAAVVSLVPANAADVKKVNAEDGTVYNAVAYKDGTSLIDAEVDDNDAAYYYKDGKYTELEDVDSGSEYTAFDTKYAQVDDGDDYFVDLEAGTVVDEKVAEDTEDDAASALRKEAKGSDRYQDTTNPTSASTVFGDNDIANLKLVPGGKFADSWYETKLKADPAITDYAAAASFTVYTDVKGNYIDADYNLGKIKVGTTASGANNSVTIENTKDKYDLAGTKDTSAKITRSITLGQDKDNIFRYAEITVSTVADSNKQVLINGKVFNTGVTGATTVVLPVIQKISKAQDSGDIDDAKYANTVTNYVISKDDASDLGSVATSGDRKDYYDLATTAGAQATVIGGKLVIYTVDNNNNDDNVKVQAASLKQKNGYYYTDVEELSKMTAEFNDKLDKQAFDTDVDGNIFVIEDGYIKKFDGTDDWTKVYKVDGSFNALSTYDADNMVAWSQEDEVYSIIGGTTADETPVETPAATTGWVKATDGTWTYVKADGTKATGWLNDGGVWYYLKADGVMATGWVQDAGTWYFLQGSGAMATGWLNDNGTWYYLAGSGAMLANTTVDGYVLGASGAWVK